MVPGGTGGWLSQVRRGTVEYCVLALLSSGERYGYEIARQLSEADGLVTSEGTIYPLLSRLRRSGLVDTTWHESPKGPPRRYYALTDEGQVTLAQFREQWKRFSASVDAVLEGERR